MLETRVGLGTDRHRFSDADVLCHAIIDALIGACKLGDIGDFFPETKEYKDAQSIALLRKTVNLVTDKGRKTVSISSADRRISFFSFGNTSGQREVQEWQYSGLRIQGRHFRVGYMLTFKVICLLEPLFHQELCKPSL